MRIPPRARFGPEAQRGAARVKVAVHNLEQPRYVASFAAILLLGLLILMLGACAGTVPFDDTYQEAQQAEPQGSSFNRHLYDGYLLLAAGEREEYDWEDSTHFANKALAAAGDQQVSPDPLYDRDLPPESVALSMQARKQLTTALERGARTRAPDDSASAQVSFDCWIQELEENHQPGDIIACQDDFYATLNRVQTTLGIPVAVPPAKLGDSFIVTFDVGSSELEGQAVNTVTSAAAAMKSIGASKIIVSGHTDTLGGADENLMLSQRRAEAVRQLLLSAGVKAKDISIATYGETQPKISTGDDLASRENRRVEINLIR